jgi:tRNA A37 threonylcarbamoyladenosine dehydratase
MHPFQRTEMLVGKSGFEQLRASSVAIIGLGGVGSYAAEAIVRAGVGHVTLVDFDEVCITNLNRQLPALRSTVNTKKAEVVGARARDINPKADIRVLPIFFNRASQDEILDRPFDMVIDCIDNMTAKVHLLATCHKRGIPVLCSLGAGGRMDPTRVRVSDIRDTHTDPFARIVRDLLRDLGITEGIECVWTEESPNTLDAQAQSEFRCICPGKSTNEVHGCESRMMVQGTVPWMPGIFGLTLAGVAVNRMLARPVHDVDVPKKSKHRRMAPVVGRMSRKERKELAEQAGFGRDVGEAT